MTSGSAHHLLVYVVVLLHRFLTVLTIDRLQPSTALNLHSAAAAAHPVARHTYLCLFCMQPRSSCLKQHLSRPYFSF